ncbi:MAG: ribonuclease III [Rhodospirillaceae bacterium]|nr:ribonuclease III [Rhodospirillaceae bacterium]|tara:strand:+ start:117 stop:857 length:741 start_codon:yes stop_codon:yes gene_type:complete
MDPSYKVWSFLQDNPVVLDRNTAHTSLAEFIGYNFIRPELLECALTHSSFSCHPCKSNERLEFLGDRVLGLVVAEILLKYFPYENEGQIARRLAAVVDRKTLVHIARLIKLGDYLRVSNGNSKTDLLVGQDAVLADAVEAILGAIYLDAGLPAVQSVIERLWEPLINADTVPPIDAKTKLQEWLQKRHKGLPNYIVQERTGPDHAPAFTVKAALEDGRFSIGVGKSKRLAEQNAAVKLLVKIENKK